MNIYKLLSVGLGGILFGIFLTVMYSIFRNLRRKMLPGHESGGLVILSDSYWQEHRQFQRVGITWSVLMETLDRREKAKTKDISLGGAFIVCENPLPIKEQFKLTIDIPDQTPITLTSEVVWSNANVPRDKIVVRGMGIRFIKNTDEDRDLLDKAISTFMEQKKDPKK